MNRDLDADEDGRHSDDCRAEWRVSVGQPPDDDTASDADLKHVNFVDAREKRLVTA